MAKWRRSVLGSTGVMDIWKGWERACILIKNKLEVNSKNFKMFIFLSQICDGLIVWMENIFYQKAFV